jgi:hypothetical protein
MKPIALFCDEVVPADLPYGLCDNDTCSCRRPWRWSDASANDFTALELSSLGEQCEVSRCCLGRLSSGGETSWRPNRSRCGSANYFRRFELRAWPRRLFSVVDALALLPNGTRVTVHGDSVGWQIAEMFLCNFLRFGGRLDPEDTFPRRKVQWRTGWAVLERRTAYVANKVIVINLVLEYRTDIEAYTVQELCAISDVLLFNFGMHWNSPSEMESDLFPSLIRVLQQNCTNTTLVFRGTNSQHFYRSGGFYSTKPADDETKWVLDTWNLTTDKYAWDIGCTALQFRKSYAQEFDWRDRMARRLFAAAGFEVALPPWAASHTPVRNASRQTLHFVPYGEITAELWDMHNSECTHICSSPLVAAPIWDALYLALLPSGSEIVSIDTPDTLVEPRGLSETVIHVTNDSHQVFFIDEFKNGNLHGIYTADPT